MQLDVRRRNDDHHDHELDEHDVELDDQQLEHDLLEHYNVVDDVIDHYDDVAAELRL